MSKIRYVTKSVVDEAADAMAQWADFHSPPIVCLLDRPDADDLADATLDQLTPTEKCVALEFGLTSDDGEVYRRYYAAGEVEALLRCGELPPGWRVRG